MEKRLKRHKLLIICLMFFSCNFETVKEYEEDFDFKVDTLDYEQIKIETH